MTDRLERDGRRCVVSGAMTAQEWIALGKNRRVDYSDIEVHHIIPFSLANHDEQV